MPKFGDRLRELFDDDVPEHGESERDHEEREREARARSTPHPEPSHHAARIADRDHEGGIEQGDGDGSQA